MHIAFLTPEYPHPLVKNTGGMGTSIKNLAEALVKQNIQVSIILYGQNFSKKVPENGISFHFIADKKYKFGKWFFYRKHVQNIVNHIVAKNKIDVIEAGDWTGFTAFMKFRVPLVIRFHGSDTYFCSIENRPQKIKNKLFEKIAIKSTNHYIAPSSFTANYTANIFNIDLNKVTIIGNPIDTTLFINNDKNLIPNTILYFGTIIRKKGVLQLPDIFNKVRKVIPEAKLILIGADSYDIKTKEKSTWKLMCEKFTTDDMKNVSYLGKKSYNEVQTYIKDANVCVFPTYAETFGMVTAEAMAMQKAVVNSHFGWSNELLVDGVSGFLANPDDTDFFAQKIIEVLKNTTKTHEIGINARKHVVKNFDSIKIAQQNIAYYQSVIKQSNDNSSS
jgi:L-malate glycosyltransferase